MTTPSAPLLAAALAGLALASPVGAQQLNERHHVDPAAQAKINRAMPQSRMEQGGEIDPKSRNRINRGCDQNIGNVKIEKGQRAPREVTTVIRGDVINLCR